jgi:hypothetical protein
MGGAGALVEREFVCTAIQPPMPAGRRLTEEPDESTKLHELTAGVETRIDVNKPEEDEEANKS